MSYCMIVGTIYNQITQVDLIYSWCWFLVIPELEDENKWNMHEERSFFFLNCENLFMFSFQIRDESDITI